MNERDKYYGICRACGKDIPPGGPRRIGICVWCVAEDKFTVKRIPVPRYGRRSDSESEPLPE